MSGIYIDRHGNSHSSESQDSGIYGNLKLQHFAKCGKCNQDIPVKTLTNSVGYICDTCKILQPIHDKLDEILRLLKEKE